MLLLLQCQVHCIVPFDAASPADSLLRISRHSSEYIYIRQPIDYSDYDYYPTAYSIDCFRSLTSVVGTPSSGQTSGPFRYGQQQTHMAGLLRVDRALRHRGRGCTLATHQPTAVGRVCRSVGRSARPSARRTDGVWVPLSHTRLIHNGSDVTLGRSRAPRRAAGSR